MLIVLLCVQRSFSINYASGIQVVVYLALVQSGPDTQNKDTLFVVTLSILLILGLVVGLYRLFVMLRSGGCAEFANVFKRASSDVHANASKLADDSRRASAQPAAAAVEQEDDAAEQHDGARAEREEQPDDRGMDRDGEEAGRGEANDNDHEAD